MTCNSKSTANLKERDQKEIDAAAHIFKTTKSVKDFLSDMVALAHSFAEAGVAAVDENNIGDKHYRHRLWFTTFLVCVAQWTQTVSQVYDARLKKEHPEAAQR